MRRVLVTHLDSPVGRRLVKALYHDPEVGLVFGVGTGRSPSVLEAFRDKCAYQRLDLARARHLNSFFHSERYAAAQIDSVIHLPFATEPEAARIPGNVPALVSETRRLLEECKKQRGINRFIYLSTAFVYRPEPGNGNLVTEDQLLGFDADVPPQVRAWIDADLICQGEVNDPRLGMTILRSASIVTDAGDFLHSPPLQYGSAPVGFNPMLSLVSDRDVARAILLALHGDQPGVYNIAGPDVFPLSDLRPRESRIGRIPVPSAVSLAYSLLSQGLGRPARHQTSFHRYGVVLDTHLAHEALGFEPQYRLELRGQGSARRVEPVRSR